MTINSTQYILLFDGVCNLCSGAVQFVIKHDKDNRFLLASLQSDAGQKMLSQFGLNVQNFTTFVLVEKSLSTTKYYTKSTAALRTAKHLGGGLSLLYAFIIVPPFIRDGVYDFVSKNRYRWFGKKEECMIPTADIKAKFLN